MIGRAEDGHKGRGARTERGGLLVLASGVWMVEREDGSWSAEGGALRVDGG